MSRKGAFVANGYTDPFRVVEAFHFKKEMPEQRRSFRKFRKDAALPKCASQLSFLK